MLSNEKIVALIYQHTGINVRQFPEEFAELHKLAKAVLYADDDQGETDLDQSTEGAGNAQQVEWSYDLQTRLIEVGEDQDDAVKNIMAEAACLLAALTGRPAPARPVQDAACGGANLAPLTPESVDTLATRSTEAEASHALPTSQAQEVSAELAREALSAVSWLYRRLPQGYGRQAHIETVIERLARETGTNIADLVERGPVKVQHAAAPKGRSHA
jgi:hypothetical protein